MTAPNSRVLLLTLSERTSAKGRPYLSGWLGKASVVGFAGEPDKFGNATWDLFVSEPQPKTGEVKFADIGRSGSEKAFTSVSPLQGSRTGTSTDLVKEADVCRPNEGQRSREGLAGGARGHGPGAQGVNNINTLPPPDRAPGWRGPSAYRRPRAPVPAGPLEQFDDDISDIGR